jgi:hypothetical protein
LHSWSFRKQCINLKGLSFLRRLDMSSPHASTTQNRNTPNHNLGD